MLLLIMMMTKEFRKHFLEKHSIARKSGLWIGNNVEEAPNTWTRTMEGMETGKRQRSGGDEFSFSELVL